MNFPTSFKFNLKAAAIIGFLGGLFFAVYDISLVLLKSKIQILHFTDLLHIFFLIIIYMLLGALGMVIYGGVAFLLIRAGGYRFDKNNLIVLQTGIFALLATSLVMANIYNLFKIRAWSELAVATGHIFFFSFFAALGIVASALKLRGILLWSGAIIFIPLIVWPFLTVFNKTVRIPEHVKIINGKNGATSNTPRPNILWIVMDTARADHFSSYGYFRATTPYIDSFAKEGVLYKNAISAAAWTVPSHASMFTGLFPSSHGTDGGWVWLGNDHLTIAEVLQKHGYYTAGFSANYFVSKNANLDQGFDTFIDSSSISTTVDNLRSLYLSRVIDKVQKTLNIQSMVLNNLYQWIATFPSIDSAATAINKLVKAHATELKVSKTPFFIFINYMEAHNPYGDTPWDKKYLGELDVDAVQANARAAIIEGSIYKYFAHLNTLSDQDKKMINALYDGDLAYLDYKIGNLLEYLRNMGILDNTLIIITSDHGENLGERNLINHIFDAHRTLTHVPLIVRYPPLFPAGTTIERLVQSVDLYPTILDVLGIQGKNDVQGYSLLNVDRPQSAIASSRFRGGPTISIQEILKNYPDADQRYLGGVFRSIFAGDYEYIIASFDRKYLYNLKRDPQELDNLLEQEPEKASRMHTSLTQWLSTTKRYWEGF